MKLRIIVGFMFFTIVLADPSGKSDSRLYFVDDHLGSIHVSRDEIIVDPGAGSPIKDPNHKDFCFKISMGDRSAIITTKDESASLAWMKKNDQRGRISIINECLYLDGHVIDIKNAGVSEIFEALPWNNGILCIGRIYSKKAKKRVHSVGDLLKISPEDIEPYCAVWINAATHRGSVHWLYGKVRRRLLVFPLPKP